MVRIILAVVAVILSAFGSMMIYHNGIAQPDAFGIGIGVGSSVAAALAFIEFVRRRS